MRDLRRHDGVQLRLWNPLPLPTGEGDIATRLAALSNVLILHAA
jgi:hypothetical protein